MSRVPPILRLLPLMFALAGCASSAKLAERSHEALAGGDLRKAYEMARRALEKDPSLREARSAFGEAATAIAIDYRTRIARTVEVDTIAAAREALEFREFRTAVANQVEPLERDGLQMLIPIESDPHDLEVEAAVCGGAGRLRYQDAERSLHANRPKEAYRRFLESEDFDPDYRDVGRRVTATLDQALTYVAILPFENQTEVRDLSSPLAERMAAETGRRAGSPALFFTRVVDMESVYEGTSVAEMRRMTRDDAIEIGRRLRADRVVYGRLTGLQVDNSTYDFTTPVFHQQVEKVADGPDRVRWIETQVDVRARERHVRMVMAYEVIDVNDGRVLAAHDVPRESFARVAWSDYRADGDCKGYTLVPDSDAPSRDRVRDSEDRWKKTMGSWTLPAFLERARSTPARRDWSSEYRGEFADDTRGRPVFLGALPAVEDMVLVALTGVEEPVIRTLRELDPDD